MNRPSVLFLALGILTIPGAILLPAGAGTTFQILGAGLTILAISTAIAEDAT